MSRFAKGAMLRPPDKKKQQDLERRKQQYQKKLQKYQKEMQELEDGEKKVGCRSVSHLLHRERGPGRAV